MNSILLYGTAVLLASAAGCAASVPSARPRPEAGGPSDILCTTPRPLYHGVFPGSRNLQENDPEDALIESYENAVGVPAAWIYFSHHWHHGADSLFPRSRAEAIRARGSVPFIRLMLRDREEWQGQLRVPTRYSLEHIATGRFDPFLQGWMRGAAAHRGPLLVEFGTEVNDSSFPWNGTWNGADPEAPERFKRAFRHLVRLARSQGADNIQWVFHVSYGDTPDSAWNRLERYYPGDEWVSWVAASVYGTHTRDAPLVSFRETMDELYPRLGSLRDSAAMARGDSTPKPIIIAEFGTTQDKRQAAWAHDAIRDMLCEPRWAALRGFAWWNSDFPGARQGDTIRMRVQSNEALRNNFRTLLKHPCVIKRFAPGAAALHPSIPPRCGPPHARRRRSRRPSE